MSATVAIGAVFFGLAQFLVVLGPRKVTDNPDATVIVEDRFGDLRERIAALRSEFDGFAEVADVTEDDLAILEEARRLQATINAEVVPPGSADREALAEIEQTLADYRAKFRHEESVAAEEQARDAIARERISEATIALRNALEIQDTINLRMSQTPYRDVGRATRLRSQIRDLAAEPIYEDSVALQEEAEEALAAGEWELARARFSEALDLQVKLLEEHRDTRFAEVSRRRALEVSIATIEAARIHRQVVRRIAEAEKVAESGSHQDAARFFGEALSLQREINEEYRQSRFANAEAAEQLEVRRQTAGSRALVERVAAANRDLTEALRDRRARDAVEKIGLLARLQKELTTGFPRSELVNDDLELRVRFLQLLQGDLAILQDRIYAILVPIAGMPDRLILSREVSQLLYSRLMGGNPSRRIDESYPVESVTWSEAREFCRRLGWILGFDADLPSRAEYRAATGPTRYLDLDAIAWHSTNSGLDIHAVAEKPANPSGVHDILGNVAEWLRDPVEGDPAAAHIAGGSVQSPAEDLLDLRSETRPRTERNRYTGFRPVVFR